MDAASPASARVSTAMDAIAAARANFMDALRRGDAIALAGLYGEDARLLAPVAEPLRGRNDATAFWGAGLDIGVTSIALEPDEVEIFDALAWEVGRYALHVEPAGADPIVDRGRYLLVYALDAGQWRRAAEMLSPDSRRTDPDGRP
ncbi:MAG: nuclear transport factor 2 family protein [Chloroflexi bacterium]|nr:nuclear transport factor 2 family protein [Chloroflexota bacterium]